MGDIKRVIFVDVAVGICAEAVEDVRLERVGGFHDKSV